MTKFIPGNEAQIGDEIRVQGGEHAGKAGVLSVRQDDQLLVSPFPMAGWKAFWVSAKDVAAVVYV